VERGSCIAHDEVPGVIFSNRPILAEKPSLVDLAPTILTEFGLPVPALMSGESLFKSKSESRRGAGSDANVVGQRSSLPAEGNPPS
jgi:hypothetical protein